MHAIVAALADLSDAGLELLMGATHGVAQTAPGLLAWIGGVCDWEPNRRRGFDDPLQPTEAAIPPEEDAVSVDAAMAIQATFAEDHAAVLALIDALVELLTRGANRH